MPLWEKNEGGGITFNKDVSDRIIKAFEKFNLSMLDFMEAAALFEKQIPKVVHKKDDYGNDYFECSDCGKKYTYRHFDGYCEKCGKRMIW